MVNRQYNKQPTRVAHIIGKMLAGGVEAVAFNYYRAIDHSKYQFDFYYDADSTVEPPRELIDLGARFIMLPPYQKLPKYIKALRQHLGKEKYKIVHSHLNTLSVFPLYAAWAEHIPVRIAHNHSVPDGNEIGRNTAKRILRCFSKVFSTDYFACSEKAGRWMFGDKEFDSGKVYLLRNAIDFDRFSSSNPDMILSNKLQDKFVVGHVGRFTYAKNHKFLLEIFDELHKDDPSAVLLLVGDGELHDIIIDDILHRGLEDVVILTGKVQNPESYYQLCSVLVLPSFFEGLSLTTIESQVAGVPVVISKAIPSEAVISNGCVYMDLFSDTADKWSETIRRTAKIKVMLNENSKDYDINIAAKKLETKYEELLKG